MKFSRRDFIKASGSSLLLSPWPSKVMAQSASAPEKSYILKPRIVQKSYSATNGKSTEFWAFNGNVPGPELRFRKGDRARITVTNELKKSTTVHWHGIRLPHAMDGVPFVSQEPIYPGKSFVYEYELKDSGTFWYHPHERSFEQVGRGLFGALIVEEESPPAVDRDIAWVLSDFSLDPQTGEHLPFGAMREHARAGRLGNVITINGQEAGGGCTLDVSQGERIRLRLINSSTARIFSLDMTGHKPWVIAFDGNGIPPRPLDSANGLLGPGMRIDLILDCRGNVGTSYAITDLMSNQIVASIRYKEGSPLRTDQLPAPAALAPNNLPVPNMKRATYHSIEFHGGEQGPPAIGKIDGKNIPYHEMKSKYGVAWTVAGHSASEDAHSHEPLLVLKHNQTCVLLLSNNTGYVHPIHLHGMSFRVLSYNGVPVPYPEWRDTVYMNPFDEVKIAFVADNPGDWMFHCHILEHAASGMMGVIRVE